MKYCELSMMINPCIHIEFLANDKQVYFDMNPNYSKKKKVYTVNAANWI